MIIKNNTDQAHSYIDVTPNIESWHNELDNARNNITAAQFDNAICAYGSALEQSETVLMERADIDIDISIGRYVLTALEMLFALRKAGYTGELLPFFRSVKTRLENMPLNIELTQLLQPLRAVITQPLCVVDFWIKTSLDGWERKCS